MLSKEYVRDLIRTVSWEEKGAERAKEVLLCLAGERIQADRPYNNQLVFIARGAVDNF